MALLAREVTAQSPVGRRVRLVDATVLTGPGAMVGEMAWDILIPVPPESATRPR